MSLVKSQNKGISPDELLPFLESLASLTKIKVVGLMTMAPKDASADQIRKVFGTLKELRDLVQKKRTSTCTMYRIKHGNESRFPIGNRRRCYIHSCRDSVIQRRGGTIMPLLNRGAIANFFGLADEEEYEEYP